MQLHFSREEYLKRHSRAIELMGQGKLDALLITAETNYNYLSGMRHFAPWTTFSRPVVLIVPREREPVLIVQGFLRADAARDSWISDVRGYPGLMGTPVDMVKEVFEELGLSGGRIGAELGYEQRLGMSYNDFVDLQRALAPAELLDASGLLWTQRLVKSEAEIAAHRRACEIATAAFAACYSQAHEGTTEQEVARIASQTILDAGAEVGFTLICSGRGNYERVAGMPTERALRKGDLIWFDLGVVYNGYWCDFCRAGVVGGPVDEQVRLQEQVCQITAKGVEAIRPGVKASDVVRACAGEAARLGLEFTFEAGRLGHGLGLLATEPPHIAIYDDTVLQPGMVVTVEPGVVNDLGAFIAEENVVVTAGGNEVLSKASRELRVI